MPSRLDRPSSLYQSEQGLGEPSDGRIDFWAALLILVLRRRLIVALTLAGMIFGVMLSFVLKPTFTAEATILPPQQSVSTASLMGQLGSIAGAASLGGGFGLRNPADMY